MVVNNRSTDAMVAMHRRSLLWTARNIIYLIYIIYKDAVFLLAQSGSNKLCKCGTHKIGMHCYYKLPRVTPNYLAVPQSTQKYYLELLQIT